jgi:hypothetical protein
MGYFPPWFFLIFGWALLFEGRGQMMAMERETEICWALVGGYGMLEQGFDS